MRKIIILSLFAFAWNISFAQLLPERKFIRSGNNEYNKGNFSQSEVEYLRAKEKSPNSYEANFNLADVLYKQERYDDAAKGFEELSKIENGTPENRSEAYYNLGNSLFKQRKLEDALEAYKNALRQNPNDQQAKFNLAYTKKLLEKDKDKNKDKNKDKQDQNKDKQDQKEKQQPQPKGGMSRDEAERILNAIQNSEDKTREKVEQKTQSGSRSTKNW